MFDPSGPVLGIDPGVSRCGYGAVARDRGGLHTVACGVLRSDPSRPLPERLAGLAGDLEALVSELRPSALAVERVLFQANARTAMSVGQASGLALVVAARAGVPVTQYSPNDVKLAVTGDGTADKAAVQEMVRRFLRLAAPPRPPDAADALALAICHLGRDRLGAAIAEASVTRAGVAAVAASAAITGASPRLAARIEAARARDRAVAARTVEGSKPATGKRAR